MTESEIPPFLTWAGLDPEFKESIPARRLAAENLYTIMEDIDRNLCYLSKRDSVPYTKTPEIAFHEWEKGLAFLDTKSSQEENALTYGCSSGRRHSVYLTGDCSAEDIVLTSHRKEIASVLEELSSVVKEFVSLFVPFSYDHCVVKKIWGALHTIASVRSSFVESQRQLWYIRPLTKENTEKGNVEQPPIPIEDCRDCRRGMAYTNPDHGIRHLKRHHFLSSPTFERLTRTGLVYNWLRTQGQVNTETQNGQQLRLLRICLKYITVLRNRAKNISDGISRSQNDNSAKYQLPNDLIDCFEATAVFISQAATSINAIKEDVIPWLQPGYFNWQPETPTVTYALNRLGQLGQNAQASMTRAEKTLALSDPETDMMTMGPAGPEFLVSVICQNLQRQEPLDGVEMDINELYQSCSSKLQYQVNQFPRKRLLRDIHSLQEELSAVKSVNEWQQKAYSNYIKVLDHHTFENATPNRKAMFPSESECLKSGLNYLQSKATELEALDNRTRQLRDHLKESVEILEEDHGKAILVFTMITTIFLPLSFITSFFGMNTADIRNTNYTQGFFWAIALPVTASIVGISVLVAYQGDKLYDAAIKIFHHIKQDPQAMSMMHPGFESIDKTKRNLPFHARPWDWRKRRRFGARRPEVDAVLLS
ncbi:hypothetical protein K469DRAFT_551060 [Zopfia rhizophila CBS 207.26]|uniref:DUF7896 domain-containing protein n=1 Tax=Zopfia rhizophila CBS 207.26 TaxID=1314779 RepID=A0A6A6EQP8_9PEZI|nr:hypothetical protein K469DRAFT_551060 [Zopfia rhizophila CBS 207.26]